MTPKQKAKELVDIYMDITKRSLDDKGFFYDIDIAKQCALMAVDEILDNVMMWWETPIKDKYFIIQKTYWANVKQEIEKL